MKIALSNHNEFEHFQDLAYAALQLIKGRKVGFILRIFDLKGTDHVLSESWVEQIEEIVGPIKANNKTKELLYRLRGIMTTTNYYLSLYQEEKNISTLLRHCSFNPADVQFKVVFSLEDEKVDIDLPKEYVWALGEGYRLTLALEKGDYPSFVSFLMSMVRHLMTKNI
jgi:hypothetical protein